MANGLLEMQSRPYRTSNLFDIPVDEGTRGMLLPIGQRQGEFSFAVPEFVLGGVETGQLPARAGRGELGVPSLLNPQFTDAAQQFAIDYGLLPALGTAALAAPSATTLRMGAGGVDTASGGVRRGPEVDDLGFYSQALEAAKALPQAKGTGQQFEQMLLKAGVKPDEIKFTPELSGLLAQPKVTREELVGLLEENRIRPQETVFYGGDTPEFKGLNFPAEAEQLDVYDAYGGDYVTDEVAYLMEDMPEDVAEAFGRTALNSTEADIAKVQKALEQGNLTALVDKDSELFIDNDDINDVIGTIGDAAEMLVSERYSFDPVVRLQDPDTGYEIVGSEDVGYSIRNEAGEYVGRDQNIGSIAEARVQAETDAIDRGIIGYGGGDTRFMEYTEDGGSNYREMLLQVPEYQGQDQGFVYSGHFDEPNVAVHVRTKDREFGRGKNSLGDSLYVEEMQSDWGQQGRRRGFMTGETKSRYKEIERELKPLQDDIIKLSRERDDLIDMLAEDMTEFNTPKGFFNPLDKNFKYRVERGSIYAIKDDGSEVLVQGRGQVERLYLPDSQYAEDYKEYSDAISKLNSKAKPLRVELKELPSGAEEAPFVGNSEKFAEVGIKRLINQAAKEGKSSVVFSSGDVQLGRWGEDGLETFYDKIIPKVGKKVAKRLDPNADAGVKFVEDATGDVSGDRFVIQITPKMREQALKGQPLFTAPNVPVPASGLLGQDQMTGDEMLRAGII